MQPIQLFALASRQAEWLSIRQEVVATNIANASTPQYRAKEVVPFETELKTAGMQMARTNPGHMEMAVTGAGKIGLRDAPLNNEIGVQISGNTVSLSTEMAKTGEIKRQFELNTQLVRTFHSMMMTAVGK
ncbi:MULTISPECIES: flagellar basal body rod protein FlgB [Agrobacterium]|uniref:Flagellar basal body rod protein FlgB n=1 Tax=Agrobacterium larrymoorei TaxID=160699 RepID=A0AAJ2BJS4_9HYPH|nr:flagellar basal body rod protein FlgB [Agrobacterium larrymoorei]MDQ1185093.1 flagellar basal-body rod protein FlgB [Agrobacterium larrymoorei]MDQ1197627.1 flagellar basal-body rod protein FlgB [Rhizobium sp. SORGH_AS_0787]MDR6104271.1 flagellar basal-body rod protein FlgB [Agrobacterium larrymoorei]